MKYRDILSSKNDVRNIMHVDWDDEFKKYLEEQYDIDWNILDEIQRNATIYVDGEYFDKTIEI